MALNEKTLARIQDDELTFTKLADDSGVLLDLHGHQVFSLNSSGAFIVDCVRSGTITEDALVEKLTEHFDIDNDTARADLVAFMQTLSADLD